MRADPRPSLAALVTVEMVLLAFVFLFALSVGDTDTPVAEVVRALLGLDSESSRVVLGLRLPRTLLAACVGGLLALSGVLLQSALRNPLAEPFTMGAAGGSLLGAAVGVVLAPGRVRAGLPPDSAETTLRMALAVLAALLTTALVVRVAHRSGRVAVGPLLLSGLAVNALVASVVALLLYLGSQGEQTAATLIAGWTHGGLLAEATSHAWRVPALMALAVGVGAVPLARSLDAILLGEEEAAAGGVDVRTTRRVALALASAATGTAVAVAGIVAFVGLLAPMAVSRWSGPQTHRRLPASFLCGAALVILADALGRWIAGKAELPAGVLTAGVGAPVLLLLVSRALGGDRT